ncbi:5-hydroxytryptamine receptor-like [Thrips palmi]|uniref:5-hydroxytryptamine receptor-like n=1 Tax=Thrips palmi TaxID=161013 RepID=A0A6P8Z7R2_THRPL|nr:5-hydroxytryptamine receptor-like [Thrips palmi]
MAAETTLSGLLVSAASSLASLGGVVVEPSDTSLDAAEDVNASLRNATALDAQDESYVLMVSVSLMLALLILATVIGNVFVIAAILLERNLQSVANYLIVSLAVADLMVACLVMPLGAVYEISQGWILGPELCDMWTSSDVLCCTASILHLVAIAMDRYWAVTNVDYIHTRNKQRIVAMIVVVWAVALVVSLAPQFGWKDVDYLHRINVQQRCLPSQDVGYQIFATCSTFYVPLLVILGLYWNIFQTARRRIHRRHAQRNAVAQGLYGAGLGKHPSLSLSLSLLRRPEPRHERSCVAATAILPTTGVANVVCKRRFLRMRRYSSVETNNSKNSSVRAGAGCQPEGQSTSTVLEADAESSATKVTALVRQDSEDVYTSYEPQPGTLPGDTCLSVVAAGAVLTLPSSATEPPASENRNEMTVKRAVEMIKQNPIVSRKEKRETLEAKRERKAAKTLAIITGAFVVCWLPFFIMALLMPLCAQCEINPHLASFFLWLGYFNSTLNPVIYTVFSPEFRQAFKRILYGGRHPRNGRGRTRDFRTSGRR